MTQKSVVDIHRSANIYRVFRILGERKKKNNSNERQKNQSEEKAVMHSIMEWWRGNGAAFTRFAKN